MSILISGANGHIGGDLTDLLSKNFKIFAIYRKKNKLLNKNKRIIWIKFDLSKEIIKKKIPKSKFIIHCAVDQKFLKKNKRKYISNNLKILNNIIKYAQRNNVKLIINLSSVDVYGSVNKKTLDENYLPKNLNTYGILKLSSEKILKKNKINFINLRLPGVLCLPDKKKLVRPWLNQIICKIQKNENIFVHSLEGKFNNITSTVELSRFINFIIKRKIYIRDTFNFASSKPILLKNLIDLIKNKLNSKSVIKEDKNYQKKAFSISVKKIEKKLQYKNSSTKNIINNYLNVFLKKYSLT